MRKRLVTAALAVSLVAGTALCVRAGDTFVYSPAAVQETLFQNRTQSGKAFGFGAPLAEKGPLSHVFQNEWANYSYRVPEGWDLNYGKPRYQRVFYTELDALGDLGIVTDLAASSGDTASEKPDPEGEETDALVFMTFFLSKGEGAPGREIDAFAKKAFATATGNPDLGPYLSADTVEAGGFSFVHYGMDYGETVQRLYRDTLGKDGKEHPAFEETHRYRMDLYFREIDDKMMGISTLASGKYYEQGGTLLAGLSRLR